MLDKTPTAKLTQLLDAFGGALASDDADAAAALFQEDGFWRDLVAFTWNIKTLEGRDQIRAMLAQQLPAIQPSGFAVAEGEEATEADGLLEGWDPGSRRKPAAASARSAVRNGQIWTLLTTLRRAQGVRRSAPASAARWGLPGAGKDHAGLEAERKAEAGELGWSRQPYCVIVGGGQGGIGLGARSANSGCRRSIVERDKRPGDSLAQSL